jgi:hypothetical protein
MPVSKRKLKANRRNAQKSCGPTSPAGKVVSAQNRIAHGLCGKFIVLESECQEDYNDLLERIILNPAVRIESGGQEGNLRSRIA